MNEKLLFTKIFDLDNPDDYVWKVGALGKLGTILQGQDGENTVLNILKWHINAIVNIKACLEAGIKRSRVFC